jgi:transcriptional regulator with XRE-family HTH domain
MPDRPLTLRVFGDRVRLRRLELGMSQEALAEVSGLHRTYVGSLERGERNVALMNLLRLARALATEPGRLLDGLGVDDRSDPPPPPGGGAKKVRA